MAEAHATRTQVGIVGAGPAGLVLGQLLHLEGIDAVVLEARSRASVEQRVRAGVLEQGTVDLLNEAGVGERMRREGLVHRGIELRFGGQGHRIPLSDLTGGRAITLYGQQEVVKDLVRARVEAGAPVLFEVDDVSLRDLASDRPTIRFRHDGETRELRCDIVAGCDGFHGVCRDAVPEGVFRFHTRTYPFAWFGSSPRSRPPPTSSSTPTTTADSPCTAWALRSSAASTSSATPTTTSTTGPTSASGRSCISGSPATMAGPCTKGRSSRRGSPRCAASSPSRCSTAGCS